MLKLRVTAEEVKYFRGLLGCSIQEAKRQVTQRKLLDKINTADTLAELRNILEYMVRSSIDL